MSVEIAITYEGSLRCRAIHGPSGERLLTDARLIIWERRILLPDRFGGDCLGNVHRHHDGHCRPAGWAGIGRDDGSRDQSNGHPATRRIGQLTTHILVPGKFTPSKSRNCRTRPRLPVHKSLHPDVKLPITFEWAD